MFPKLAETTIRVASARSGHKGEGKGKERDVGIIRRAIAFSSERLRISEKSPALA